MWNANCNSSFKEKKQKMNYRKQFFSPSLLNQISRVLHGFQARPLSLRDFFLHPGVEKPGHSMASFSGKLLLLVQWVQGTKKANE